jgi:hypothetical protein
MAQEECCIAHNSGFFWKHNTEFQLGGDGCLHDFQALILGGAAEMESFLALVCPILSL